MDIGSVKPVLTGVTSPVPKTPTEQNQSTTTDLKAEKAVKVAEKTDGNTVDTASDKPEQQSAVSAHSLTEANTVKASSLDQLPDFGLFASDESTASQQTDDSSDNAAVIQDSQEFAMRMQAMIEAWEGTGGTPRTAVFDRKI
ncbi:MAG: hypothetical protein H6Q99_1476 [Proteobacteria bacterium]|nr:hypothetical protein [Pseudomonadota bacterium]